MKTLSVVLFGWFRSFAGFFALAFLCTAVSANEDVRTIKGEVKLHQSVAGLISPGDRLVFKLFHPLNGIENDLTYRIYRSPVFPFSFEVGPNTDMSKRTKWRSYVLEVFLDRDDDAGDVGANEPRAITDALVPLGSSGIELVLELH